MTGRRASSLRSKENHPLLALDLREDVAIETFFLNTSKVALHPQDSYLILANASARSASANVFYGRLLQR